MQESTPQRANHLHRRSLLLNTSIVSSPLRKSMGPPVPVVLLEPIDDEAERSSRRSMVAIQRRLTNITATSGSSLNESNVVIEENQIQDHLRICAKLYTENRISSKNAWQLHVIDVMRKICSSANTQNVLQVAGSSLDIGAKVYGLRVDDVHAKGLQLASSMAKNNERQQAQEDGEEGAPLEISTRERRTRNTKKKTKKMASDKRNTIDKEKKTLFAPIKHVDAAVFATKENIDISATDNLFTQKLPTNPANHQLVLLCGTKYWFNDFDTVLDGADTLLDIEIPEATNSSLCVPFKEFETGTWDPEEEERLLAEATSVPDAVLDENGLPIAELDGSIHDIFEDNNDVADDPHSETEEHEVVFQAQIHGEIAHIVDAVPEESRVQTEYGYNEVVRTSSGKYIDKIWAGPSHWKVKFNRRSAARYSGSTVQPAVKHQRKAKTAQPIDFTDFGPDLTEIFGKYVVKRAAPTASFEKITLPVPELGLSSQCFKKLTDEFLIKPGVLRPRLKGSVQEEQRDYEVQTYNYENPNDSQYCSQHNNDDGVDAEPMQHSFEEEAPAAAHEQFLDDNLVNAPEMVSSTHIPYAMQAKKMDMKKLKTAIWKCLTNDSKGSENPQHAKIKPIQFSELYHMLPQFITPDMKKELTSPLVIVAFLHLCNENNLDVRQNDRTDFTIVKAVESK